MSDIQYLVGNNWVNCLKTHNNLAMCLSGETTLPPEHVASVSRVFV